MKGPPTLVHNRRISIKQARQAKKTLAADPLLDFPLCTLTTLFLPFSSFIEFIGGSIWFGCNLGVRAVDSV